MKSFLSMALLGLAVVAAGAHAQTPAPAADTAIWFGGVDPVVQQDRHTNAPADYMDLFKPDAPWSDAAAAVKVFKISTQLVLRGTDEQLQAVIEGLRSRHIALAIELGVLVYSDRCGRGTEGYGAPLAVETVAKRITALGGRLDYVAMDEPVTWGHAKQGKNAQGYSYCQDSIEELVSQVAPKLAVLQKYFPGIRIGEIDAVNSRLAGLDDGIIGFIDILHRKTGLKPAFVHADVAWDSNWQPQLENLVARLRARGVRVGVVFDGDPDASSDKQWIAQALDKYRVIMQDPKTAPEDLVFQTWSPRPGHMLPETDPGAWTYAVRNAVHAGH
jgi:hypothetical protein